MHEIKKIKILSEQYEQFFQKNFFLRKLTDRSVPAAASSIPKKFSTSLTFIDSNYWLNSLAYGMNKISFGGGVCV
jgi:hypothetical protein